MGRRMTLWLPPPEALALPGFVSWNICSLEGEAKTQGAAGQKR
jgi:hypothetical protein